LKRQRKSIGTTIRLWRCSLVLNVTDSVKGMVSTPFFCLFSPFSIFFYLILPSENQDLNAAPKKQPKT